MPIFYKLLVVLGIVFSAMQIFLTGHGTFGDYMLQVYGYVLGGLVLSAIIGKLISLGIRKKVPNAFKKSTTVTFAVLTFVLMIGEITKPDYLRDSYNDLSYGDVIANSSASSPGSAFGTETPDASDMPASQDEARVDRKEALTRYFNAMSTGDGHLAHAYATAYQQATMYSPREISAIAKTLDVPMTLKLTVATDNPNAFWVTYHYKEQGKPLCKNMARITVANVEDEWLVDRFDVTQQSCQ